MPGASFPASVGDDPAADPVVELPDPEPSPVGAGTTVVIVLGCEPAPPPVAEKPGPVVVQVGQTVITVVLEAVAVPDPLLVVVPFVYGGVAVDDAELVPVPVPVPETGKVPLFA